MYSNRDNIYCLVSLNKCPLTGNRNKPVCVAVTLYIYSKGGTL